MRELKTITEANALVDAADKFDDIYLRIEALANHAHDLIKYAGEEQAVSDWWQGMQDAMQKMQAVTNEIRQPNLPGMESVEEQPQDAPQVQEETQMSNIDDMIASLSKLAGLPVAEGSKPDFLDVDKDGNKKEPFKAAVDDKEEDDKDVKESVELDEECGMPIQIASSGAEYGNPAEMMPHMEPDADNMQGDMYKLDVKTANKTMTFITDNPEEIMQVLKASGIDVKSSEAVGYQPPAQVPVPQVNSTPASPAAEEEKTEEVEEEDEKVAESIAILRKMSGFAPVSEGKFGNSVAGSKGDPRIVGDTIDFALAGSGNGKSGRGDKGLSTIGDNPLGRNDRDVTESIYREFAEFLKEGK